MVLYGQIVVGPPGAGKTTYCNGMQQYLRLIGREALVVNLDPANELLSSNECNKNDDEKENDEKNKILPYETILDVCEDVVNLSSVMDQLKLGPNGGLMYCMEYIERHLDHIIKLINERLPPPSSGGAYLLFDFPGQVELYTHCTCVQNIVARLQKELDLRLCAVQLVDSHYCTDATKFISAALLSTTSMLRLELPTVNILSKIDLINQYGAIPYNLDFFTDCQDLNRLVSYVDGGADHFQESEEVYADDDEYQSARTRTKSSAFYKRHIRLHSQLCEVIEDFSLLNFLPLNISDAESVGRVVARIDKCNGYVFVASSSKNNQNSQRDVHDMFQCAMQMDNGWGYEQMTDIHERYLDLFKDNIDDLNEKSKKK